MNTSPESTELRGQLHVRGCALDILDGDSLQGDQQHIRKICGLAKCSFQGYVDSDGITVQDSHFSCYRANNGFEDEANSDVEYTHHTNWDILL